MKRLVLLIVCLLAVLLVVGCSTGTDGASLVKLKCGSCHAIDWVTDASADTRADWAATVDRMEVKGLVVTDDERATILEYLNAEYGAE